MIEFANQVAIDELEITIEDQKRTLLHIKAELEFIKQHPFDMVLVVGSIENIYRVIEGQIKPFVDEECVGCCRVQCDTELIEKLRTEIHNRDKTIKDFKAIETKETDRLHKIILDMDVTISDLMDNDRKMNGFLDEYRVTVDNRDKTIEDQKRTIDYFINCIGGLEAELSACKEDSKVLMKVVEIVKEWQNLSAMVSTYDMRHLRDLVKDYLDAPEGPPETSIDDLYKVTVTYAFLEMP